VKTAQSGQPDRVVEDPETSVTGTAEAAAEALTALRRDPDHVVVVAWLDQAHAAARGLPAANGAGEALMRLLAAIESCRTTRRPDSADLQNALHEALRALRSNHWHRR
jgi:hypothetical protein